MTTATSHLMSVQVKRAEIHLVNCMSYGQTWCSVTVLYVHALTHSKHDMRTECTKNYNGYTMNCQCKQENASMKIQALPGKLNSKGWMHNNYNRQP